MGLVDNVRPVPDGMQPSCGSLLLQLRRQERRTLYHSYRVLAAGGPSAALHNQVQATADAWRAG